jgi:hypothetical protein
MNNIMMKDIIGNLTEYFLDNDILDIYDFKILNEDTDNEIYYISKDKAVILLPNHTCTKYKNNGFVFRNSVIKGT